MRKDLWTKQKKPRGLAKWKNCPKRPAVGKKRTISLLRFDCFLFIFLPCPFLPDEAGFDLTLCFACVL
uniref:Uncharacterized protein n=1 Tax=Ixodes ricinus TaxID=34613 RepID=A0A090XA20_IXORI